MTAAMRLTTDSAASERRPTEPVSHQAAVFMPMVTIAAAIESHAKRVRLGWAAVIARHFSRDSSRIASATATGSGGSVVAGRPIWSASR
jgi:hypothetical protein